MVARPEVGVARPSSSRMVVDFPAPFGPRNPVIWPGARSKVRSLTALTVPYRLVSASTAMVLMAVPPEVVVNEVDTPDVRGPRPRAAPAARTHYRVLLRRTAYSAGCPPTAVPGQPPGVISPDS